jgi:hypothetical protein
MHPVIAVMLAASLERPCINYDQMHAIRKLRANPSWWKVERKPLRERLNA